MSNTSTINFTAVRSCENGQMTAIILGWNPDRWNDWNYADAVERVAATGLHLERWSVGRHRNIAAGTDAWLLLQGDHGRGLIGHGVVVSEQPEAGANMPEPAKTAMYVQVAFDSLLPLGDQIAATSSGKPCPGSLGQRYSARAGPLSRPRRPTSAPVGNSGLRRARIPRAGPGTYPQGAVTRVEVNRYERTRTPGGPASRTTAPAARPAGSPSKDGEIGRDFIHVHHVVPVSQLGSGYELDPITDLVPLCANCHAMAHQGVSTPRTVAELRRIIGDAGFLRGSTVTDEQLEAQRGGPRAPGTAVQTRRIAARRAPTSPRSQPSRGPDLPELATLPPCHYGRSPDNGVSVPASSNRWTLGQGAHHTVYNSWTGDPALPHSRPAGFCQRHGLGLCRATSSSTVKGPGNAGFFSILPAICRAHRGGRCHRGYLADHKIDVEGG